MRTWPGQAERGFPRFALEAAGGARVGAVGLGRQLCPVLGVPTWL